MNDQKHYFFCGIGGSGMLPLAMIVKSAGAGVSGSDRSRDQGRTPEKFDWLTAQGIELFNQDGSGIKSAQTVLVTSGAVEDTIPDVKAAIDLGAERITRPQLLAQIFNEAETSIGVAGTSGKSTTTGMIGWILHEAGLGPTVVNGAVMKNFVSDEDPFASALTGNAGLFVSEVDESDGSISLFDPVIAVLNNISIDHKTLEELRSLFRAYVERSETAILNLDNEDTRIIAGLVPSSKRLTYSLTNPSADFFGRGLKPTPQGIDFDVTEMRSGRSFPVSLKMHGAHNVSNALAALATAQAVGVALEQAIASLETFGGIKRRLEYVGTAFDITVIDDFAHNPDKIAASLNALHDFEGRLLVFFQPHGFGPLAKMKDEFIETFVSGLGDDDILLMCEPVYYGGTVERTVSASDICTAVASSGKTAEALATREACGQRLKELSRLGDRIIVMGARDDTLSEFARGLLE